MRPARGRRQTLSARRISGAVYRREKSPAASGTQPAIQSRTSLRVCLAYSFGEAAGLAAAFISFFAPFSPLAAFTSTSFAVMV
jgi:hypothetical protein